MGILLSHVLGSACISTSREICKKRLTLECDIFSNFCRIIRNHFPHVLGTILLMWRLIKFLYFRSHFQSNVYVEFFTNEVNLFCWWAQSNICISDPFVIEVWKYLQYKRVDNVFHISASIFGNISLNMATGIPLKIDPSGLQQK